MVATESAGLANVIERAMVEGRTLLPEPDAFDLLAGLGFAVPRRHFVHHPAEARAADLRPFGARIVVKVVSAEIAHKSDVGGVEIVPATPGDVAAAVERMVHRGIGHPVDGFTLHEFVEFPERFGSELLLGLRQTDDFGPVVVVGVGGIHAEALAAAFLSDARLAYFTDPDTPLQHIARRLAALPVTRIAAGLGRDHRRLVHVGALADLVRRLLRFGASPAARHLDDLEINPLALAAAGPVALDVLVRLRPATPSVAPPRPLAKLRALLEPRSIAVVGVSAAGENLGRLILRNLLHEGFPPQRLFVIKGGVDLIDGVRCVPDLGALPEPVDLCVVAVAAGQVSGILAAAIESQRAEAMIVIPGGLGEREGSGERERDVRRQLARARQSAWGGPVVNGGNCLGVRSVPGGYDTTFIPDYKLPRPHGPAAPLALIAQSGAFAIARWSRVAALNPRYLVSVGNQTDLTVGDYLTYLEADPAVRVFACYVEGFRPLDGRRWLDAAARLTASGRTVLLYRGARTPTGARAGASHTATIAGDYAITRALAVEAGVLVAETIDEFDDLLRLSVALLDRPTRGGRLGAVSNAGFECVAAGDAPAPLTPATLGSGTIARLEGLLASSGLDDVVSVHHPLDLTPTMNDAGFEAAVRAVLDDDQVDTAVVGCVPLTGALETLPPAVGHLEDAAGASAVAARLGRVWRETRKPWVTIVDAGDRYDPFALLLEREGIPTFRTMDRALRALARWCDAAARAERGAPSDPLTAGT